MNADKFELQQPQRLKILRIITTASDIIRPPRNRNAGEWADDERILPPEAPEPGKWRTDRVPFWRDIYAAFSDTQHQQITVVCGSQMSKTEGMFNIIGHRLDDGAYVPVLYIAPTEKLIKSVSKDRIDKMLRSSKSLWSKVEKGQRNGVFEKFISGVRLGFAWAGSATELASHPAGLVLIDERDRMRGSVGGEGDPVSLGKARAKNYPNRKIGIFSTPTEEGASPVWDLLDEGTLHFWAWGCKHCHNRFVPQLSLLIWPQGKPIEEAADAARVVCPHCGGEHSSRDKIQLNGAGAYIRHRRLNEREATPAGKVLVLDQYIVDDDPKPKRAASYWISGLASPWATFADIADELLRAYKSGDDDRIQAIINTYGGELYKVKGDAPDWEEVAANRLEYPANTVPSKHCQVITMGADVQKYGIFYSIRGWGYNAESWLIEADYIAGETEFDNVWLTLGNILQKPIGDKPIMRAFIDSGYRPGDTHRRPDHAVYTFCRRFPGLAFPTKGQDTMDIPFRHRDIDYSYGGELIKNGVRLYSLNTDYFKRWVHSRVKWPDDNEGGWHLYNTTSEDYCRQIIAEELIIKSSGRAVWLVKDKDNHYLDCEVGATAAAYSLNVHKLPQITEQPKPADAPQVAQNTQPQQTQSPYSRRGLL